MKCNPDDQAMPSRNDANQRGVTKLEYISTRCLQGILTCAPGMEPEKASDLAVTQAEALIARLNRK